MDVLADRVGWETTKAATHGRAVGLWRNGQSGFYTTSLNLKLQVLTFVQFGGQEGRTWDLETSWSS